MATDSAVVTSTLEPPLSQALAWLDSQQSEMESVLRGLVEENSHTAERARVDRVGARLTELLDIPGLALEARESPHFGRHLAFHTAAAGRRTMLVGHHDTVFPPGTFEGMREDGPLLRGPGVLDMKGGLVVIRFALQALERLGALSRIPLTVVSVADEEVGSPDSAPFVQHLCANAASALVFEAGRVGDAIITRRKGTGGMTASAQGRAAHAGNAHQDGVNAIWALSRFVVRAQELTDYPRGITVNVGKFTGGMGKNTVPDHAEAAVDFRFVAQADGVGLEQALHAAGKAAQEGVPGSSVQLQGGVRRPPLERSPASAALMTRYAACARASGLGDAEAPLLGGGSDANTTSAAGVPSIDGLGPRGKGFHTVEEFIERATLVPKAQALLRFLWAEHPLT